MNQIEDVLELFEAARFLSLNPTAQSQKMRGMAKATQAGTRRAIVVGLGPNELRIYKMRTF